MGNKGNTLADLLRMIARRRGAMSIRQAASEIGINHALLSQFVAGNLRTLSAESAILLAAWLDVSAAWVCRVVGRAAAADVLDAMASSAEAVGVSCADVYINRVARSLDGLPDNARAAVCESVESMAAALKGIA